MDADSKDYTSSPRIHITHTITPGRRLIRGALPKTSEAYETLRTLMSSAYFTFFQYVFIANHQRDAGFCRRRAAIYIYIYIHKYNYICINTQTCTKMYIYLYIYIATSVSMPISISAYVYIYMYTCDICVRNFYMTTAGRLSLGQGSLRRQSGRPRPPAE